MKIFAKYFEKDKFAYRSKTILQFGKSWDLIGNIVLANPGSASPKQKIDKQNKENLENFFEKYHNEKLDFSKWFEFEADSTMRQIEKLFSGYYTHDTIWELNGVIQLFNIFNAKDSDLQSAIKNLSLYDKKLCFDKNITFCNKPVYFGFTQSLLNNDELKEIAKNIFTRTPKKLKNIFNDDFNKNKFYHLGYIQRQHKNYARNYTKEILLPLANSVRV